MAIEKYNIVKGLSLGIKRISKCHPFHPGGIDEL
jgi:putative component of membrane protein insertase Oxa1/YidC/SpoIIIJ protein YidD